MTDIQLLLFLPLTAGVLLFLIPEAARTIKGIIALLVSAVVLYTSYNVFLEPSGLRFYSCRLLPGLEEYLILHLDNLSRMVILFIGVFSVLLAVYSLAYMTRDKQLKNYYNYFLITLGAAAGAVLANNFVTFTTFWGILGITLYKLINGKDEASSAAAKKSLIMIGASDSILILGIGILWKLSGTLQMSEISVPSSGWLGIVGFLCLVIASLTKAGAFPVHTWLPDYVANA
ncbi:MAG: hypothetical protein JW784_06565, partial [Candidatus Cloacimonetes bacterium]|nr:hypothetical protein [Candidatus Cloacimonadota bacterium]